jgi:hypothetical protein
MAFKRGGFAGLRKDNRKVITGLGARNRGGRGRSSVSRRRAVGDEGADVEEGRISVQVINHSNAEHPKEWGK